MQHEQQSIMELTENIKRKTIIYLIYMLNKHVSCLYSLVPRSKQISYVTVCIANA